MKRIVTLLLSFVLGFGMCACGGASTPDWQEQYDLGVKYLSEGNYEEAIIAFTAAIEIDSKRAEAYVGLAEVYTVQGDLEKAKEILKQGLEIADNSVLLRTALEALDAADDLNDHGMVGFTERAGYCSPDELPPETILLFEKAEVAMRTGDIDAVKALFEGTKDNEYHELYTSWNGYRVRSSVCSSTEERDDSDFWFSTFELEMRSENGIGYTCNLWYQADIYHDVNARGGTEEDYYSSVVISECPCTNWQWNGELRSNVWTKHWEIDDDGSEAGGESKSTVVGFVNNNLLEGTHREEGVRKTWGYSNAGVESYTVTSVYSGGKCIEDNGMPVDYAGFCSVVRDSKDDVSVFFW